MTINEVPQDLKYMADGVIRDVAYAVDEDGRYQSVVSDGWAVKNDVLELVWDDIHAACEAIREQVRRHEASPLAYHMTKNLQDPAMLAAYAGIPKRKVKKHLTYDAFMQLDESILKRYADALRITVDELRSV